MNIQGKVIRVMPVQSVGANNFQKREIHVEIDSDKDYPQILSLFAEGKKVDEISGINAGDVVDFSLNLKGREYTGSDGVLKVFNTLSIWKADVKVRANVTAPAPVQPAQSTDIPF
jgi:single-strand DNA-binding protein